MVLLIGVSFALGFFWTSPDFYKVSEYKPLPEDVIGMKEYMESHADHSSMITFEVEKEGIGKAYILGLSHSKDPSNLQFDSLETIWSKAQPTAALVEGRLGFLFSPLQHPISEYGASGLVKELAQKSDIPIYTWEPEQHVEVEILLKEFTPKQLAAFYAFRPYFSNRRFSRPENPEEALQDYLESRTDYPRLKGVIENWQELEDMWNDDYRSYGDWRDFSDQYGWPEGYLYEIWNASNGFRNIHQIQVMFELIEKGEMVFITMGTSHAVRIESALRKTVLSLKLKEDRSQ